MSLNTILATAPLTTTNYILKATGTTIGNSLIQDDGSTTTITGSGEVLRLTPTGVDNYIAFRNSAGTQVGDIGYDGRDAGCISIWNNNASGNLVFGAGGSRRMTITSSGNVGIGTSSPAYRFELAGSLGNFQLTSSGAEMFFTRNENNDILATGGSSAKLRLGAISQVRFGTGSNYDVRMTVESNGQINTYLAPVADWGMIIRNANTGNGNSYGLKILAGNGSGDYCFQIANGANNTSYFIVRGDGYLFSPPTYNNQFSAAANGYINSDGSFGRAISSLKYKTDIIDYDKGLIEVMKLRPVYYKSKNEKEYGIQFAGLIAEDLHDLGLTEFVQYAVDGTPDAIGYPHMIALLTKAIQELSVKNEELSNRLIKLENK